MSSWNRRVNKEQPPYRLELDSVHTQALGRALGKQIQAGQVIALIGDLGAGKTTFTQGLASAMGIDDIVTSPTFTLVNEYGSGTDVRLIHIDTYRLDELPDDAILESATFGLDEILDPDYLVYASDGGAVVVIEWAERIAPLLPEDHLELEISQNRDPQLRKVVCTAYGPNSAELLRSAIARLDA
jgi:tRNA threonylcarbamoyladenosine biosynthesis protein TsaE